MSETEEKIVVTAQLKSVDSITVSSGGGGSWGGSFDFSIVPQNTFHFDPDFLVLGRPGGARKGPAEKEPAAEQVDEIVVTAMKTLEQDEGTIVVTAPKGSEPVSPWDAFFSFDKFAQENLVGDYRIAVKGDSLIFDAYDFPTETHITVKYDSDPGTVTITHGQFDVETYERPAGYNQNLLDFF